MGRTYSDSRYIYSVDMMFVYLNIVKPKAVTIKIDKILLHQLEHKGWGDPEKNIHYSPHDVLKKPKKYVDDYNKILDADLKYPIIMYNGNIVDGIHRLTKSYLQEKKTIKTYQFDSSLMKKFVIAKKDRWGDANKVETYQLIQLFMKRFHKELCK